MYAEVQVRRSGTLEHIKLDLAGTPAPFHLSITPSNSNLQPFAMSTMIDVSINVACSCQDVLEQPMADWQPYSLSPCTASPASAG
jgi:hypothetical protein